MKKVLKLAVTDFKLIFRDSSLKAIFFIPVILFVIICWGLPPLVEEYDFLIPYLPVFLIVATIENTQMFCFISSMVLIDEKESDVAKIYGVVPLTKFQYLVSRFIIPYLFTAFLNVLLFTVQPFYTIGLGDNLLISFYTAMVVPVYVLGITSFVQNRMQGMVYIKAFNMLVLVPIAAFFIPENMKHLFGVFPTHWIFQSVAHVTQGLVFWPLSTVGILFMSVLLWFLSRLFVKRHFV